MLPEFLHDPAWLAVLLSALALIRPVKQARRLNDWWQTRHFPKNLRSHKDRKDYELLLRKYEAYLDLLENLIVTRSQVEEGSREWTPGENDTAIAVRENIYSYLEQHAKKEKDMGVFQLLDVLDRRMVGATEERSKRSQLEARQAEIEKHPLFVKRQDSTAD